MPLRDREPTCSRPSALWPVRPLPHPYTSSSTACSGPGALRMTSSARSNRPTASPTRLSHATPNTSEDYCSPFAASAIWRLAKKPRAASPPRSTPPPPRSPSSCLAIPRYPCHPRKRLELPRHLALPRHRRGLLKLPSPLSRKLLELPLARKLRLYIQAYAKRAKPFRGKYADSTRRIPHGQPTSTTVR